MKHKLISFIFASVAIGVVPWDLALACPEIDLSQDLDSSFVAVDFNGNAECSNIKGTFTGDSIVYGLNDGQRKGGYPGRIRNMFPKASINNQGISGITSSRLLQEIKQAFAGGNSRLRVKAFMNADFILVALGVNDYWRGVSPSFTVREIKRIVKFLRREVGAHVMVGTLTQTRRAFQQPFVDAVNSRLLRMNSDRFPVVFRFDRVHPRFMSDTLHPNARGYRKMKKIVIDYLSGDGLEVMRARRPDDDVDGIYNAHEAKTYGTDPFLADTDGDGQSDGLEILTNGTDPLNSQDFIF